ncbi:MAG TPA: MFS transporter [Deltaproteobacteria bacterium]|nr:MFS transporter [Deltaproteobacteria bacterium]
MNSKTEHKKIFGFQKNVFVAGLVSLFMDISSEMIYPLVPLFLATVLGTTKTTIGLIEGIAESTASILKVFSGYLSDVLGRRKLLMAIGYGVSVLSRPVTALSTTWFHVLFARFVDRFGKGIRTAPRDAIIADSADGNNLGRAFGFHRTMDTIGAVIGPAIAFFILLLFANNFRLVFWLSLIPGIIAVILIVFFITEKRKTRDELAKLPKITFKDFNGDFRHYIVVIALFSIGNTSDAFLILRAENLGVSKEYIPIIYLMFNLVYSVSSMPLGILADKIGMRKMIILGFIFYALIYFGFGIADSSFYVLPLFCLYGIFKGMSEGTQRAYLATLAPPERKATAFGVYHTVVGISLLPASIIGGILWDKIGAEATFFYGAVTGFISAVLFILLVRNSR